MDVIVYNPSTPETHPTEVCPLRLINQGMTDEKTHCWFSTGLVNSIHAKRSTMVARPEPPDRMPIFSDGFDRNACRTIYILFLNTVTPYNLTV